MIRMVKMIYRMVRRSQGANSIWTWLARSLYMQTDCVIIDVADMMAIIVPYVDEETYHDSTEQRFLLDTGWSSSLFSAALNTSTLRQYIRWKYHKDKTQWNRKWTERGPTKRIVVGMDDLLDPNWSTSVFSALNTNTMRQYLHWKYHKDKTQCKRKRTESGWTKRVVVGTDDLLDTHWSVTVFSALSKKSMCQ